MHNVDSSEEDDLPMSPEVRFLGDAPTDPPPNAPRPRPVLGKFKRMIRRVSFIVLLTITLVAAVWLLGHTNFSIPPWFNLFERLAEQRKASPTEVETTQPATEHPGNAAAGRCDSQSETAVKESLETASKLWQAEDYQGVIQVCGELLDDQPGHGRALYIRGWAAAKLGHWAQAVEDRIAVQEKAPELAARKDLDYARAFYNQALEAFDEAEKCYAAGHSDLAAEHAAVSTAWLRAALNLHPRLAAQEATIQKLGDWAPAFAPPAQGQERNAPASPYRLRQWRDMSGSFAEIARFVRLDGDRVRLQRADDSRVSIPRTQLSEPDQQWVRQRARGQPASAD